MNTREIIQRAKAGTLNVPYEVDADPHFGVRIGDRVAYCSIGYLPSLPFIANMPRLEGWREWLKLADTGTVVGIVTKPTIPHEGPYLSHDEYWASTAEIEWDNGTADRYIKIALLQVADADHPIPKS